MLSNSRLSVILQSCSNEPRSAVAKLQRALRRINTSTLCWPDAVGRLGCENVEFVLAGAFVAGSRNENRERLARRQAVNSSCTASQLPPFPVYFPSLFGLYMYLNQSFTARAVVYVGGYAHCGLWYAF